MAKDYFQDITPPSPTPGARAAKSTPAPDEPSASQDKSLETAETAGMPEKTIRNIPVASSRARSRETREPSPPPPRRGAGRVWLWGGVVLALLALGAIALVALRPTTVTIVPRSHSVLFDETAVFTAYPAASAATGTLSFTTETITFEDFEVVSAEGVEEAEERASGTITIYNEYSREPVRLIANTRFQTPDGLVFRIRDEVRVPGRSGTTPGQLSVSVFADEPGAEYNVGPIERFTLPGLASTPSMHSSVYARSTSAMAGGFVGERPIAAEADVNAARAAIRDRLQAKVLEAIRAKTSESTFAFADFAQISFETLPRTEEAGGGARIHERVRVELPLFEADDFAYIVAQSVSADVEDNEVMLRGTEQLSTARNAPTETDTGAFLQFVLTGRAQLVWNVDTVELAEALAGRDETAFQAIVERFPGVEEAHARIEPFWKNSFPENPTVIRIKIEEPELGS